MVLGFFDRTRIPTRGAIAIAAVLLIALGTSITTAFAAGPTIKLVYSKGQVPGTPLTICGASVTGVNTAFLTGSTNYVKSVSYSVTGKSGTVLATYLAQSAPFAFTFDATGATAQSHEVNGTVTTTGNRKLNVSGSIGVNGAAADTSKCGTKAPTGTGTAPSGSTPNGDSSPTAPAPTPAAGTPSSPAPAGPIIYVSTTGNDSNSGTTQAQAKKTINGGMSAASAGYTVLVAPGTYNGNFVTSKGGAAGKFITVRSQTRHGAKIYGDGSLKSQSAVEIKHAFVRFQDFDVTGKQGTRHGVHIDSDNTQIVGNKIHDVCNWVTGNTGWKGGAGIQTGKANLSNVLIDGNIIFNIGAKGSTEQLVHGMYIDSHVKNTVVSNNIIYNVEDFGLHPYDETESSGWIFENNVIAFTGRGILQAPNGITRNNIVYQTRGDAYVIRGSGNVVENNIAFGGKGGGGGGSEGGTINQDPMFVNPTAFDFRLKPGSPAINKGLATGAPKVDILGKPRPQGGAVDIGAYEQ